MKGVTRSIIPLIYGRNEYSDSKMFYSKYDYTVNSMIIVKKYHRKTAASLFCLKTAYKCLSDQSDHSSPSVLAGEGSGSADLASWYSERHDFVPEQKRTCAQL